MFILDEKVVYPGHGVAKIHRIVEKKIADNTAKFFELKFLSKDMTILVPTHNLTSVGVRRLSSVAHIKTVFKLLREPAVQMSNELSSSNWNKRNKEYQCKLRSGSIQEISKIYRDLKHIAAYKELSFGEKNLLQQTEALLAEEIAIVHEIQEEKAVETLRAPFKDLEGSVAVAAGRGNSAAVTQRGA